MREVLVPSLGILLFNDREKLLYCCEKTVLVPSLGILLFNTNTNLIRKMDKGSRPLSGDSFI